MRHNTLDDVRFDIDVKIRYHDRRRAFLDHWHKAVMWVSVFGGSAAAAAFWASLDSIGTEVKWLGLGGALTIAGVNALDAIVGFAERARLHDALYRRYVDLDVHIVRGPDTQEALKTAVADILMIERDEPPGYYALYSSCYNETIVAQRREGPMSEISSLKRLAQNFFRFSSESFPLKAHKAG